jgi:hypothetical protein
MSEKFALHLPLNSTSFGNIGISICRQAYLDGHNPCILPIGGVDLSGQIVDIKFNEWLQKNINKFIKEHNRKTPAIRLWHCNQDALQSISDEEHFITFIETDSITEYEKNILSQKKTVFVTSNYFKRTCEDYGLNNVKYLQLGFDSFNFKVKDKKYWNDDRIVFNLLGKWERRKGHQKVIQSWLKRFGASRTGEKTKYFLQAALYNPFLVQNINGQTIDHNARFFKESLGGKEYGNIHFLNWINGNDSYSDFLQSSHAVIGMGGGENFGAGEFHSVGLGKHSVILNANGFKDWADTNNSCLVQPSGKEDSADGIFFNKGNIFQQGNFFTWNEDDFINKCEECIKRIESNPINNNGLELQERTYKSALSEILKEI